jgi:hypothetical protein
MPQPEFEQLMAGDYAVLAIGELGDCRLSSRGTSTSYFMVDVALGGHCPIVAVVRRRVGRPV